jgi:hypothetical protein
MAHVGKRRGAYRVLVGKSEGTWPFGRHSCRLEDNIKMDLNNLGWEGQDWIDLAWTGKGDGLLSVAYPGILLGGGSTNSVEGRGQGSEGGSPLVTGPGGSCKFVQEISFHIVKFF